MRSHVLRLYVFSISLVLFFVLWAVIAARPWTAARSGVNPALRALEARERHLRHEARVVERTVRRWWAGYRRRLHAREAQIKALERRHAAEVAAADAATVSAAAYSVPASRVVTLPPQAHVVTLPPTGAATSSGSSHP
jgi:type IV secretory pathway TraG/TraD family ATPase VirD4